jgi:hypothetical protein
MKLTDQQKIEQLHRELEKGEQSGMISDFDRRKFLAELKKSI